MFRRTLTKKKTIAYAKIDTVHFKTIVELEYLMISFVIPKIHKKKISINDEITDKIIKLKFIRGDSFILK